MYGLYGKEYEWKQEVLEHISFSFPKRIASSFIKIMYKLEVISFSVKKVNKSRTVSVFENVHVSTFHKTI